MHLLEVKHSITNTLRADFVLVQALRSRFIGNSISWNVGDVGAQTSLKRLGAGERKPCVGLSGVKITDTPGGEAHQWSKLIPYARGIVHGPWKWAPAYPISVSKPSTTTAAVCAERPRLTSRFTRRPHMLPTSEQTTLRVPR